jgi:hypothetical protein
MLRKRRASAAARNRLFVGRVFIFVVLVHVASTDGIRAFLIHFLDILRG